MIWSGRGRSVWIGRGEGLSTVATLLGNTPSHDVATTGQRAKARRQRLPGLAPHDHRVAERCLLEETHVLGQLPEQVVVLADDAIARHGGDQSQRHTATGALIAA